MQFLFLKTAITFDMLQQNDTKKTSKVRQAVANYFVSSGPKIIILCTKIKFAEFALGTCSVQG